ncbi:unnamed protein product [Blepharisma stoltei]|uniref:Cyclic nucleotide-binding domain-containing protein n=1 Tax=Blepharisma stoltei TaxID=1481888 RepID=A0AAU9I9I0_9CILI|nr:unnamed protein product [Blepharisma stoltei]
MLDSLDRRNTVAIAEDEHFLKFKRRNTLSSILKDAEYEKSLNQVDSKNLFKLTRLILALKPYERTPEMIEKVHQCTLNLKFFQKIREEHSEDIHVACCKYLQHEFHPAHSLVIRQGETGTKFYIILEGKVSVIRENEDGSSSIVAELSSGDSFGERALMLGVPRACSIRCITNCSLGVLEISEYKKILESLMEEKYNALIEMLRELPMFKNRSSHYLQRLTYYFKPRKCHKKQCIYKEGDPANEVFLIQKGEFNLSKKLTIPIQSPRGFPKNSNLKSKSISRDAPIVVLGKGSMFGEEEILSGIDQRTTSCICMSREGCVLVISKESFQKNILKSEEAVDFMKKRTENKLASRQTIIEQNVHLQKLKSGIIPLKIEEELPTLSPLPPIKQLQGALTPILTKTQTLKVPGSSREPASVSPFPDLSPFDSQSPTLAHSKTLDAKALTSTFLTPRKPLHLEIPPPSSIFSPSEVPLTPTLSTEPAHHIRDFSSPPPLKLEDSDSSPTIKHLSRKSIMIPLGTMDYLNSPKKKFEKNLKIKKIVNIHTYMMKSNSPRKESNKLIRTERKRFTASPILLELKKEPECEQPKRIERRKTARKTAVL